MRRLQCLLVAVVMLAASCGTLTGSSGASRTVLIDHSSDEFASAYLSYYPNSVEAHPGETIQFRQTWTGEPHSVTFGPAVTAVIEYFLEQSPKYPDSEPPPEVLNRFEELVSKVPSMSRHDDPEGRTAQNGAQPCYLDSGDAPTDPDTPCPKDKRKQPLFNGRQSLYNSGFIPYQGPRGNTFSMKLSPTLAPGTYRYMCNFHSAFMNGSIVVKPRSESVPSPAAQAKRAQRELAKATEEPKRALADARRGKLLHDLKLPAIGVPTSDLSQVAINEFVPSTIEAKVGQKVSWHASGENHTLSFNVPKYFPLFTVAKDGTVTRNPLSVKTVGFPEPPKSQQQDSGPPPTLDGGTFDGSGGFRSTGASLHPGTTFTLAFTKPGTYLFACVIHPPMVGKVVVR